MMVLTTNLPFMKAKAKANENVHYKFSHADGTVFAEFDGANVVTNTGKAGIASRINGAGGEALFDYIAIGTGTTSELATDTALETEITTNGGARAQDGSPTRATTDVTDDTSVVEVTYTFTGSFAVTEAGLFNASSAGVMLARQTFASVNVVNTDQLTITWKIDID